MPIYEYSCNACHTDFEQLVRSSDEEAHVVCPSCGKRKVERRMSITAAPRAGAKAALPVGRPGGGCGRCGDPNGPCGS